MDSSDTFQFLILVILLLLSAFFSSAETALMTVNKIRLRSLADDGNRRAALVLDTTEKHTSKMLSAILDRKSTRLNSSHITRSRMPSSA